MEKCMTRKNKEDWLKAGLKVLAQAGLTGLTIDAMAHELGLTKGSFYHHFDNVQEFEQRLLVYWADQYLSTSESLPDDPWERLSLLDTIMEQTFSAITAPEIAIRLWAQQDDRARPFVERIDAFRRQIVYDIFVSLVDDPQNAWLMTDMLFTITIGSMTALPQMPAPRVLELYREFKRLYSL
jgi:AcrR family transcriptional regulator